MPDDALHAQEHQFTEEMGLFWEQMGAPRMAGRILGWLLVCDLPRQTSAELAQALGASKGSISTNTRLLTQMGLIERVAVRGERSAFYQISPGAWERALMAKIGTMTAMRELAERGLDILSGAPTEHRRRLEEVRDIYAFFESEFPRLMERYRQQRAAPDQEEP